MHEVLPQRPISYGDGMLSWQAQSKCNPSNAELFFPGRGDSPREAIKLCNTCTVREKCLNLAVARGEDFGIWGALTTTERKKLIIDRAARITRAAIQATANSDQAMPQVA